MLEDRCPEETIAHSGLLGARPYLSQKGRVLLRAQLSEPFRARRQAKVEEEAKGSSDDVKGMSFIA